MFVVCMMELIVVERDSKNAFSEDSPSWIKWAYTYHEDYNKHLWIADKDKHDIKYIDSTDRAIYRVTGKTNSPGFRNGNVRVA